MKFKITCRPRIRNSVAQKFISSSLAIGLLLNNTSASLASVLSEDGRYETFEGDNITISNVLEEDTVDVEIEGNTMVNVANQKDPVPITKEYSVEGTNHISLQGEYDGKARPVIEGNTMYYNNDTGELLDTFVEGANLSLVSSFEDQLVTQDMVDSGLEKAENLGKYKVEYKITGKNKFDLNNIQLNTYQNCNISTGLYTIVSNSQSSISGFISVKPNTTYSLQGSYSNGIYYTIDKKPIKGLSISNNKVITTPNDCYYIVLNSKYGNQYIEDLQVEEGVTATEYEPYKESIKTFYLNSPLLDGDTIEDIDGKATHVKRYNQIILDGSDDEGWDLNKRYSKGGQYVSYASVRDIKPKSDLTIYCDKIKYIGAYDGINDCIWAYNNSSLVIQNSTIETLEEFKQWLSENPITVVYPLANPIYETISEESILRDSYTNGHLDLNSNIPVNKVDFIPTTTNLNYLYPSTEYVVQFESDNVGKIDTVSLGDEVLYSNYSVSKGINRFNITTPSIISSNKLTLDGVGFNLSNLVVTQATSESFDYFEGIKSVGQDDKNGHKIEIVSSNNQIPKTNILYKDYGIEINFTSYAIKENLYAHNLSDKIISVHTIKDGVYSRGFSIVPNSTILINLNEGESIYCFAGLYGDGWNNNNIELLKKSLILTRNSTFDNIEIPLTEPLRSLSNGVKDRIIKRNGQWVIERNCKEIILNGSENWYFNNNPVDENGIGTIDTYRYWCPNILVGGISIGNGLSNSIADIVPGLPVWSETAKYGISTNGSSAFVYNESISNVIDFKNWLSENPITVIYQLENPIYEPLNIDSTINLYLDATHISNNSNIPTNMKVTVDRTINRATESIELAKTNPTVANISNARYWSNLLKESLKKDQLQDEVNSITNIDDLQLERKSASSNLDIYVKSENMLSLSLDTNSVTFDSYSGTEDMEMLSAVNISINSSLPYDLNAYISSEISNGDKSETMPIDILNIKESSEGVYQRFDNTTDKVVLKDSCNAGNNKIHDIDLKLASNLAHKADVYKTVIKFEAEQK